MTHTAKGTELIPPVERAELQEDRPVENPSLRFAVVARGNEARNIRQWRDSESIARDPMNKGLNR